MAPVPFGPARSQPTKHTRLSVLNMDDGDLDDPSAGKTSRGSKGSIDLNFGPQASVLSAIGKAHTSHWMTEEVVETPKRHLQEHIKHVLCKKSFFLALVIATLATTTAAACKSLLTEQELPDDKLYTTFSTLVSFFVVIRTGHALSRMFEASTIVYSMLGDWSDAVSSLLCFTRKAVAKKDSVNSFQNMLVILVSMLNALCLAELENSADSKAFDYNLVNFAGFPPEVLAEISQSERKVETVFQMIQSLIVDNMENGILNVPPPILTRSFQEISQAMLKAHEAHKLVNVPYPIDLNAAGALFLVIHTIINIRYLPSWLEQFELALAAIFVLVFSYWFIHFICSELEHPFSARCTAIDLAQVQDELNLRLQTFVVGARREPLPLRADLSSQRAVSVADKSLKGVQRFASQWQEKRSTYSNSMLDGTVSPEPSSDSFRIRPSADRRGTIQTQTSSSPPSIAGSPHRRPERDPLGPADPDLREFPLYSVVHREVSFNDLMDTGPPTERAPATETRPALISTSWH